MKSNPLQQVGAALRGPQGPAWLTAFFASTLAVSMTFSPFVLSLSMWALVFLAYGQAVAHWRAGHPDTARRAPGIWLGALALSFQRLAVRPSHALFVLLLLTPALSGLWSSDQTFWLERVRVRLPFLVLPWAFANLPALQPRQWRLVLHVLVWVLVILCIGVGLNFLVHYDSIMRGLSYGHAIPVPRNHIRFNLILATGIISGGWLWWVTRPPGFRFQWHSRQHITYHQVLGWAVIFLFAFIHVLSVRSGLAALYAALLFSVFVFIRRSRRWGLGLGLLGALLLLPWLALKTLPSLNQRVGYMQWDWAQMRDNPQSDYSDTGRWVSLQAGWQLWQAHPLLGVGAGDLPAETERVVMARYPDYEQPPKLPHNQVIYILAGTGLLGLALSLVAFLFPIFLRRYRRDYLFSTFQVMALASFLVEYTIETSMGVAWYLFYTLWFMQRERQEG